MSTLMLPPSIQELVRASGISAAGDWAASRQGQVIATYNKYADPEAIIDIDKQAFSVVDTEVQSLLLQNLGAAYPKQFHLIAEESDAKIETLAQQYFLAGSALAADDLTLIIDPIDGSANYLSVSPGADQSRERNKDFWAISLCLLRGAEPVAGVMYYPNLGVILTAEKGQGTLINNQRATIPSGVAFNPDHPMRISHEVDARLGMVKKKIRRPIRTGSVCVFFLALLKHSVNDPALSVLPDCFAYIGNKTFLTDLGVGTLAWTEAGGVVMDMNGNNVNPFASAIITDEGLRARGPFFVVASKEYGMALLKYIYHHPVPTKSGHPSSYEEGIIDHLPLHN